jgi:hypothetical protein
MRITIRDLLSSWNNTLVTQPKLLFTAVKTNAQLHFMLTGLC